jgi:AcrR family transcriptional regulator
MDFAVRTKTPLQAEKILTAAARLFATQRFHEARMEDIAAAAAVGKGTLYRYFRDKDQLYHALLVRAAEQLTARLHEEVGRAAGPRARLEALVAAIIRFFDEQPHLFDLIQHAEVTQGPGDDFPWQEARAEAVRLVQQVFAEGRESGVFRVEDPDLAVYLLLGGVRSVIRFTPRPRAGDLPRRIVDHFLQGAAREDGEVGRQDRRTAQALRA